MMRADDIHARIDWPTVLALLGIPPEALRLKKSGACPNCGGHDRYTFDNRRGRGDFICRACGAGSGFDLLMRVHRWDFRTARDRVVEAAGFKSSADVGSTRLAPKPSAAAARPPARVRRLRTELCRLEDCDDAIQYLDYRGLWPAAASSSLRAHASVEYYDNGQRIDRYPALVADVQDFAGKLVTTHVTYLANGRKLAKHEPRKIFSPMVGREACAVRLYPITGDSMGVAEGLETAIAASVLHDNVPVWSALNTALLAKFTPPANISRLIVFADRDLPGMTAAATLIERLQGQIRVEIRAPASPHKDWNDDLFARGAAR